MICFYWLYLYIRVTIIYLLCNAASRITDCEKQRVNGTVVTRIYLQKATNRLNACKVIIIEEEYRVTSQWNKVAMALFCLQQLANMDISYFFPFFFFLHKIDILN